jgi:hypothetical protein
MMTPKPRRYVTFTVRQLALLEEEAARLGLSVNELIRRIIDDYFDKEDRR